MMMPDREKVISGLEYCTHTDGIECPNCPYWHNDDCVEMLNTDVLSLLKEQEAVEPTLIREGRNKNYNDYVCPRCDNEVVYEQNYCSECGVQFLWEGL